MTVAAVVAAQTIYQGASPNAYLFPGLCKKANGDFLMMARRASGHTVADGTLVSRTSSTGLTGSWSAETVVFAPSGVQPNVAAGLPRLLDDGRIALMAWYNNGGTTPYIVTSFVSTDETATSWVRGGNVPAVTSDGVTCESPIVVAPDGTWLLAVSGTEVAGNHPWSSWIVESGDEGATWTFKAWVARTASPSGTYPGGQDHEEPWLLHVENDTYLCAIRTGETGWTSSSGIYTHIWRSTDGCVTWTDLGRLNSTHKHFSRMAMCRNPLTGTIMLHHRLYGTGGSGHTTGVGQGAYYWTNDDADTWSTGKLLDGDGAIPSNPSQPPGHSYGDIVAHDGGFAAVWADEVPITGSSPAIRFATFSDDAPLLPTYAAGYGNTVSSGYDDGDVTVYEPPPASILVDPDSPAWDQIDTQIVVRVTADAPSSVAVTFTSADGSLVWFRGADADLFEVSLDGTTWKPRLDVPAGETDGFLRVTPAAPGTTLTAEIGISA